MANKLEFKSIKQLLGEHFFIPSYQRGYRWTKQQVEDLLNDIWLFAKKEKKEKKEKNSFYCLQPVVIKTKKWEEDSNLKKGWEVIDGQQRLTTIYIVLSYLEKEFLKKVTLVEKYGKDIFSIRYETRKNSAEFLNNLTTDRARYKENIDFYYMSQAYDTVKEWFTNNENIIESSNKDEFLHTILGNFEDEPKVQFIWYEIDDKVNSLELFTRLNIGRIPLTNSELVKALFLSTTSFKRQDNAKKRRIEISLLWDEMEHQLNDPNFWAFVTNKDLMLYTNKIELILDMISDKPKNASDPLFTFLYFFQKLKDEKNEIDLMELWLEIEKYYLTLCEWFKDKNLYHQVGYLILINEVKLKDLIEESFNKTKYDFNNYLNDLIRKSVKLNMAEKNIEELSYEKNKDKNNEGIRKILLLFNIESIRENKSLTEYFPFKLHKSEKSWSLEHIHSQNPQGINQNNKKAWNEWLKEHKNILIEYGTKIDKENSYKINSLINKIDSIKDDELTWEIFSNLADEITIYFTEDENSTDYDTHSISNLALIDINQNSALNNSVFEVKRRKIIELDKKGDYIPICTRRVFLKYYNSDQNIKYDYLWRIDNRKSYFKEIKRVLSLNNYLPQKQ